MLQMVIRLGVHCSVGGSHQRDKHRNNKRVDTSDPLGRWATSRAMLVSEQLMMLAVPAAALHVTCRPSPGRCRGSLRHAGYR